jgi:hypothetical protein
MAGSVQYQNSPSGRSGKRLIIYKPPQSTKAAGSVAGGFKYNVALLIYTHAGFGMYQVARKNIRTNSTTITET